MDKKLSTAKVIILLLASIALFIFLADEIFAVSQKGRSPSQTTEAGVSKAHYKKLNIDIWLNKPNGSLYFNGEPIIFYFKANMDCFVILYDFDTYGNVNILFPNDLDYHNYIRGGVTYSVPSTRYEYDFIVEGPPGWEFVDAVASINPFLRWRYYPDQFPPLWFEDWPFNRRPFERHKGESYSPSAPSAPPGGRSPDTGVSQVRPPKREINRHKEESRAQYQDRSSRVYERIRSRLIPYPDWSWDIDTVEFYVAGYPYYP